jgi:CRISPR/Cas system CMR-associated protein Cmr5 small subunit
VRSYALEAARSALNAVRRDGTAGDQAALARAIQELPALLRTSGLGQTAAYLKGKGARELYDILSGWLCGNEDRHPFPPGDLLDAIMAGSREQYVRATEAAWILCEWLKPLAVAYLPKADPGARR